MSQFRDTLHSKLPNIDGDFEIASSGETSEKAVVVRLSRGFSKADENIKYLNGARFSLPLTIRPQSIHLLDDINMQDCLTISDTTTTNNKNMNDTKSRENSLLKESNNSCFIETPSYTFTLPDLSVFEADFRQFLERDLIEVATMKSLETTGQLNWWMVNNSCQKLWPLATSGDGNCLLHAASLGMWGFHDRLLILRKALHLLLTKGSRRHALWRRWRWQQTELNEQSGLVFSEEEWKCEWEAVVRLSSPQPRKGACPSPISTSRDNVDDVIPNQPDDASSDQEIVYESLEELHVFALSHVLKRPIIVVADTVLRDAGGEPFAPIPFGGIYLPLECSPDETPLVLVYDAAHFSALVTMTGANTSSLQRKSATLFNASNKKDKSTVTSSRHHNTLPAESTLSKNNNNICDDAVIPITDVQRSILPLHFQSDPGADFTWWKDEQDNKIANNTGLNDHQRISLICRYMDVVKIPVRRSSSSTFSKAGFTSTLNSFVPSTSSLRRHSAERSTAPAAVSYNPAGGGNGGRSSRQESHEKEKHNKNMNKLSFKSIGRELKRRFSKSANSLSKKQQQSSTRSEGSCSTSAIMTSGHCDHSASAPATVPIISLGQVCDSAFVVGARLSLDNRHEFMEEMVRNYLLSARRRFEDQKRQRRQPAPKAASATMTSSNGVTSTSATSQAGCASTSTTSQSNTNMTSSAGMTTSSNALIQQPSYPTAVDSNVVFRAGTTTSQTKTDTVVVGGLQPPQPATAISRLHRRERISRSISATNVNVKCMNGNCQNEASHSTNFLCEKCFEQQKSMMESFSVRQQATPAIPVTTAPAPHVCLTLNDSSSSAIRSSQSQHSYEVTRHDPPGIGQQQHTTIKTSHSVNVSNWFNNNDENANYNNNSNNTSKVTSINNLKDTTRKCPNTDCEFLNSNDRILCRLCATQLASSSSQ